MRIGWPCAMAASQLSANPTAATAAIRACCTRPRADMDATPLDDGGAAEPGQPFDYSQASRRAQGRRSKALPRMANCGRIGGCCDKKRGISTGRMETPRMCAPSGEDWRRARQTINPRAQLRAGEPRLSPATRGHIHVTDVGARLRPRQSATGAAATTIAPVHLLPPVVGTGPVILGYAVLARARAAVPAANPLTLIPTAAPIGDRFDSARDRGPQLRIDQGAGGSSVCAGAGGRKGDETRHPDDGTLLAHLLLHDVGMKTSFVRISNVRRLLEFPTGMRPKDDRRDPG